MLKVEIEPKTIDSEAKRASNCWLIKRILCVLRRIRRQTPSREAALKRVDVSWLVAAIISGGMVGPVLLMWGLAQTPASSASLLLNLEGVFSALLAWFVFKENFDTRIALGMALIAVGGICVSWMGRSEAGVPWGALGVLGACFAWVLDNNLTRKVLAGDPVQFALLKGPVAGSVNTALGLGLGAKMPGASVLLTVGGSVFLAMDSASTSSCWRYEILARREPVHIFQPHRLWGQPLQSRFSGIR